MSQPVLLISFMYPHEAHMAANYLESEGISTILQDELTVQVDNFYSNAIGGVKIMVPEEEYELGKALLIKGGYIQPEIKKEAIEYIPITNKTEKKECPYCHSKNIGINRTPNIISIIVLFLIHAFFPFFKKTYYCYDCTKKWRYRN